jgi:Na+-driven multidrug efflux pump
MSGQKESRMQILVQVVLALVIAALLLIVLFLVLAIQVIRMLAEVEENAVEHPASEPDSVRR